VLNGAFYLRFSYNIFPVRMFLGFWGEMGYLGYLGEDAVLRVFFLHFLKQ